MKFKKNMKKLVVLLSLSHIFAEIYAGNCCFRQRSAVRHDQKKQAEEQATKYTCTLTKTGDQSYSMKLFYQEKGRYFSVTEDKEKIIASYLVGEQWNSIEHLVEYGAKHAALKKRAVGYLQDNPGSSQVLEIHGEVIMPVASN